MELRTIEIPGYDAAATIYESHTTMVCRAIRRRDQLPVILKILKPSPASHASPDRYHHELEMIRLVHSANVIQAYGLETWENTVFLVLEDIGGSPLSALLGDWRLARFSLAHFLKLTDQIVEGIAAIHASGVIHKDVCPSNIVYNPQAESLRIIDFDLSTTLDREVPSPKGARSLDATIAYIAPEQTGRMNRAVDYRSDFYSLGATLYHLLTGRLPLESSDPAEQVHFHLARTPPPPTALNPAVSPVLSAIVMKLMSKAPEERYQSSRGLLHDLRRCGRQAEKEERAFDLGLHDRAERFLIPEKLYGRAHETAALLSAFDRAAAGSTELVMVSGASGIGKTSIVNEISGPVERRRGHFIRGKFDQFNHGIPFAGFLQALQDLIGQVVGASDAELAAARAQILSAVGESGGVMIDVVPDLERIIGSQPPVPALAGVAAQNRFNLLACRLVASFAAETHPLVIFLDDMQWADLASLELLRLLVGERKAAYLLLVGAFREDEVPATHPLSVAFRQMEEEGVTVSFIALASLKERVVTRLIADTLGCPLKRASPLARLVFEKTGGNPFFINRFVEALHAEGLIAFNAEAGFWECDVARVGTLALGDDIMEFMTRQVEKLPAGTQEALKLAACVGSAFDLGTLAIILQKSLEETAADVWPALEAGLLLPLGQVYRFQRATVGQEHPLGAGFQAPSYRFFHDRARQAAYSMIPDDRKPLTHLHIGRMLRSSLVEEHGEERLFEIAGQLNQGIELEGDPVERRALAEMNLQAGRCARAATAFSAAAGYLAVARRLLGADCWDSDYRLTLDIYEASVEAAYLYGNFEEMRSLGDIVRARARDLPDRCKVYEVEIEALAVQNRMRDAIGLGLDVLHGVGTTFPAEPTAADVEAAIRETRDVTRAAGIRLVARQVADDGSDGARGHAHPGEHVRGGIPLGAEALHAAHPQGRCARRSRMGRRPPRLSAMPPTA